MIATLLSMMPMILTAVFFTVVTYIILKLWYSSKYIHRKEVKPLQESQHMMQNQYAILAERIKHTENQLNEYKSRLEIAIKEREQAIIQLHDYNASHINNQPVQVEDLKTLIETLKATIDTRTISPLSDEDKNQKNEQVSLLRQNIKEFKTELFQKLNMSSNQFHELSNQLWMLIELNKKMNADTEQINKLFQNPAGQEEAKIADRQFTLASIKKRS